MFGSRRQPPNSPPPTENPPAFNRRKPGRIRTCGVVCTLGELVDISSSGLRVRGKGRPPIGEGQATAITLGTPAGLLAVEVGVVWCRRTSWRHYEMGLLFLNITSEVAEGVRSVLRGATVGLADLDERARREERAA